MIIDDPLHPNFQPDEALAFLAQRARNGESGLIIGMAGVGKSNLLRLFAFNPEVKTRFLGEDKKNILLIYTDFNALPVPSDTAALRLLLQGLLAVSSTTSLPPSENDQFLVWLAFKKQVEKVINEGKKITFLIDRFDKALKSLSANFFDNLRALRDDAKGRSGFVFTLRDRQDFDQEKPKLGEIVELVLSHVYCLRPTLTTETLNYLSKLAQSRGLALAENQSSQILRLSGGHKGLLNALVNAIAQTKGATLKNPLTENAVLSNLEEIFDNLTIQEKEALQTSSTTKNLFDLGILVQIGDEVQSFSPLFTEFVKNPMHLEGGLSIATNPLSVLKNNVDLSDRFTNHEARLLVLLAKNANQVVGREQMIATVYPDVEAEGVSDHAIDQLVHRVREKIEDDPENPKHLLTVRGRGHKLALSQLERD